MPMSDRSPSAPRLSKLSGTLRGSAILNIAGEVRALKRSGRELLDLTVGDFSSKQFRIPRELEDGIVDALRAGESTYPPPIGLDSLRAAVHELYLRRLGLDYPIESILSVPALGRRSTRPTARWSIPASALCSGCRRGTTTPTPR